MEKMKKARKILAIGIVAMLVLGVGLAIAQAPSNGYVVINAPLSPEEREDVYHIPSGSIVYHSADGVTTVYTPNGKCILKARDSDAAMIATPHGTLVPATHIIQSPAGSSASYKPFEFYTEDRGQISTRIATKIYAPDGTLILSLISENKKVEKEEPGFPTYDGWIEDANDWSVDWLYSFVAYWDTPSVPPSPESNTVDYLFNAIEPGAGGKIIQPVLEWNYGGSSGWTGAAWWGPDANENYHRSSPIQVSVGDRLRGALEWYDSNEEWEISIYDSDKSAITSLWAPENFIGTHNLAVFVTLEGYNINDDTDVPGDTDFHDMSFNGDTPTWTGYVDGNAPLTGLEVEIVSQPDRVILHTAN